MRMLLALLLLWPSTALAGACDRLVLSSEAGLWTAALQEAGLELAGELEHCGAQVEQVGSGWWLVVRLGPQDERRSAVPSPDSPAARLDIAILAASLLAGAEPPPVEPDLPPTDLAHAAASPAPPKRRAPPVEGREGDDAPGAVGGREGDDAPGAVEGAEAVDDVGTVGPLDGDPLEASADDGPTVDRLDEDSLDVAADDGPTVDLFDEDLLDAAADDEGPARESSSDLRSAAPAPASPWIAARLAASARPGAWPTVNGGVDGGALLRGHLALGGVVDLQGPWDFSDRNEDRGVAFALGGGFVAGWAPGMRPVAPRLLGRLLLLARRWQQDGEVVSTLLAPVAAIEGGVAFAVGRVTLEPHGQLRFDLRRTELILPDDTVADLVPVTLSIGVAVRLAGRGAAKK